MLRDAPLPRATANCPPCSPALGSIRKPPAVELKFGVNSIARASLLAKLFHRIQNSTVTALVLVRLRFALAVSLTPSKPTEVSGSLESAPGAPSVGPPAAVALLLPVESTSVVPLGSPMRQ